MRYGEHLSSYRNLKFHALKSHFPEEEITFVEGSECPQGGSPISFVSAQSY